MVYNMFNEEVSKAHQARACVVCSKPVVDERAERLSIGGGLELLCHKACLNALSDALEPKKTVVSIPVGKTPVSTMAQKSKPTDTTKGSPTYTKALLNSLAWISNHPENVDKDGMIALTEDELLEMVGLT